MLAEVGLHHFLFVGLALFCAGMFCVLTRRNAIGVLMGVELILNAANVNYMHSHATAPVGTTVRFSRFS